MKKIFLSVMFLGLLFASCNKEDCSPKTQEETVKDNGINAKSGRNDSFGINPGDGVNPITDPNSDEDENKPKKKLKA